MMNQRHLMAQLAGRASVSLQTQLFFKARDIITDGLIMSVRLNGILVYAPEFGIEYMIRLISLEYKVWELFDKEGGGMEIQPSRSFLEEPIEWGPFLEF
jgi:exoribonuclease R